MRRLLTLAIVALGVATAGCTAASTPEPTEAPTPHPTATPTPTAEPAPTSAPSSERRCGDGVCDGPEDAHSCPTDCGPPALSTESVSPTRSSDETQPIPPVYVTLAGHIEDTPVYAQCEAYPEFREKLLLWAETVSATGAAVNLQIDYEFLLGASRCETAELQQTTGGTNVIHYLATDLGFEIDAHQEGGWEEGADNYADVRFLAGTLTPAVSENVGGLVWNDAEQLARLSRGEPGRIHTDFTWSPQILTLAVSRDHHLGDFSADDVASGIWIPEGANESFWTHDPAGSLVYVGPGERTNWDAARPNLSTPKFVRMLAHRLRRGAIARDRMYTASIPVPQSIIFNRDRHQELLTILDQLEPLIESGQAAYVTYAEAVDIWRSHYGSQPNVYIREGVEHPWDVASEASSGP